jgi:NADH dehydrogenase (ubiquinone) Fe-S protein 7
MKSPATIPGNDGAPPPMSMARREVPLPSQENKKGAIQYALYAKHATIMEVRRDELT